MLSYAVNAYFTGTSHDHVENLSPTPLTTLSNGEGQHPACIGTTVIVTSSPPAVPTNTAPPVKFCAKACCNEPVGRFDIEAENGPDKMDIATKRSSIESIEFGCVTHCLVMGLTLGLQRELSNVRNVLSRYKWSRSDFCPCVLSRVQKIPEGASPPLLTEQGRSAFWLGTTHKWSRYQVYHEEMTAVLTFENFCR